MYHALNWPVQGLWPLQKDIQQVETPLFIALEKLPAAQKIGDRV